MQSKQNLIAEVIYEARANEAATQAFDQAAYEKLGVNVTDGRCLGIIDNEGPLTAGRLAEVTGLTTAAITAVLDRLERAGYARRIRDVGDRRRVIVELTPELRARNERIWGPIAREGHEAFARMSREELTAARKFFRLSRELNEQHAARVRDLSLD